MGALKQVSVTVVGGALVAAGVALMVLPGPGIILVAGGLAVLATRYLWARRLVDVAMDKAEEAQRQAVASKPRVAGTVAFALGTIAVGLGMVVVEDVRWPLWDAVGDALWSPFTGGVLIVTSLILLATTGWALRSATTRGTRSPRA
jgi:hypothetical protein